MTQESQATRLAETVLTIQTLKKMMKRARYNTGKGKRSRQEEEENSNINLQVQEEEEGIRWGKKAENREGSEGEGTPQMRGRERKRKIQGKRTNRKAKQTIEKEKREGH